MTSFTILKNNNSQKLLAGLIALVLVAGMTSPAFAGKAPQCEISPTSANVEITQIGGSDFVEKQITCFDQIEQVIIRDADDCDPYEVYILDDTDVVEDIYGFTEQITSFGTIDTIHCTVTFEVTTVSGNEFLLDQDLWINMPDELIGGTVGSMSTTSLLVAGAQSNMGLWSLALVGIVGAAAAITYKVKSKSEQ